jgi:hypothetical protein
MMGPGIANSPNPGFKAGLDRMPGPGHLNLEENLFKRQENAFLKLWTASGLKPFAGRMVLHPRLESRGECQVPCFLQVMS